MSSDIECPYCGADQDVCHDDGYGYAEDRKHSQQCYKCEKEFVYTTSISFYYEAEKADCLNGAPHTLKKVDSYPPVFPDWVRCSVCDYEDRGQYKEQEQPQ